MKNINESSVLDLTKLSSLFKDFCEIAMTKMEKAHGVVKGLSAVMEGDRGIYELGTMPMAPLMRRDNGRTTTQNVYGPAYQDYKMNASESGYGKKTLTAS